MTGCEATSKPTAVPVIDDINAKKEVVVVKDITGDPIAANNLSGFNVLPTFSSPSPPPTLHNSGTQTVSVETKVGYFTCREVLLSSMHVSEKFYLYKKYS